MCVCVCVCVFLAFFSRDDIAGYVRLSIDRHRQTSRVFRVSASHRSVEMGSLWNVRFITIEMRDYTFYAETFL